MFMKHDIHLAVDGRGARTAAERGSERQQAHGDNRRRPRALRRTPEPIVRVWGGVSAGSASVDEETAPTHPCVGAVHGWFYCGAEITIESRFGAAPFGLLNSIWFAPACNFTGTSVLVGVPKL